MFHRPKGPTRGDLQSSVLARGDDCDRGSDVSRNAIRIALGIKQSVKPTVSWQTTTRSTLEARSVSIVAAEFGRITFSKRVEATRRLLTRVFPRGGNG